MTMPTIKDWDVLNLHENLKKLVTWTLDRFPQLIVITSAYRPGDSGVHGAMPLRGVDFRCHDDYLGSQIEDAVNTIWGYDNERPLMKCAVYHDVGQGKHIHLQTHANTYKKSLGNTAGRYPT